MHTEEMELKEVNEFCDTSFNIVIFLKLGCVLDSVTSYSPLQPGSSYDSIKCRLQTCKHQNGQNACQHLQDNSRDHNGMLLLFLRTSDLGRG